MTMPKPRILLTAVMGLLGLLVLAVPSQLRAETVKASEIFSLESVRAEFIDGSINGTAYDRLTYNKQRSGSSDPGDTNFPALDGELAIDWQQAVLTYVLTLDEFPVNVTWKLGNGRLSGFTSSIADGGELDLFSLDEQLSFGLFEAADGEAEITVTGKDGVSDPLLIDHGALTLRDFRGGRFGLYSVLDMKAELDTVFEDRTKGSKTPFRMALAAEAFAVEELEFVLEDSVVLNVGKDGKEPDVTIEDGIRMVRQEIRNQKGFRKLDATNIGVAFDLAGIPAEMSIGKYTAGETRGLVSGPAEMLDFRVSYLGSGETRTRKATYSGFDLTEPVEELLRRIEARPDIEQQFDQDPWSLVSLVPAMDFGSMVMEDMTTENAGHIISIAEVAYRELAVDEDQNLSFVMDIVDFDLPRAMLEDSPKDMVWRFLDATDVEKILLNFGLSVNFDMNYRNLAVTRTDLSLLDLIVMHSTISLGDIRMIEIAVPATAHSPARSEQQLVADLDRFDMSLEDIGFVRVAAAMAATPPQTGNAVLIDAIAAMRAKAAQASSPAGKSGYSAIADFLSHSGTLRIAAEPQQKVSLREAFPLLAVSLDFAAQIAGFRVTHEP